MSNDSSTGGYLAPLSVPEADDAALDLQFQPVIAGITGLAANLVRRRGQETPAPQPPRQATWCSFAVTTTDSDLNPNFVHDGNANNGEGLSYELRVETVEVLVSFYGPAASGTAKVLRDGLGISQNREAMRANGLAYVGLSRPIAFIPDLVNGQFIRRADIAFKARRMAVQTYAIRNVAEVVGTVVADTGPAESVTSPVQFETGS